MIICTHQGHVGLGWIVTASFSITWQDLHTKTTEMPLLGSELTQALGNDHSCLHYPLGVCIWGPCVLTRGMLVLDGLLHPLVPLCYQIYTKTVEMLASELPLALGNWSWLLTLSFRCMYVVECSCVIPRGVLVSVGLLQALVPSFDQIYTKTIEMPLLWPGLPLSLGNDHLWLHYSLGVCIWWPCVLTRGMLVLDRLLHPLVPLFYQIYTKTVEMLASELPLALGNWS
jgi:hypothetical protein